VIYTFYSFKGGVGRSMALANVAELFYRRGLRVLMVDFDLEAPGLERYFNAEDTLCAPDQVLKSRGVIDLLNSYIEMRAASPWLSDSGQPDIDSEDLLPMEPLGQFLSTIYANLEKGSWLKLLPAGRRTANFSAYADSVLGFRWDRFYSELDGERFFRWFRTETEALADVVLIDSRTGVTEMGGVCTHQLADVVVCFVGTNEQNLQGTMMMASSLSRDALIESRRRPLDLVFVPSRVEPFAPDELDKFERQFNDGLAKYFTKKLTFEKGPFLDLRIPYTPEYAYVEDVAVHKRESASNSYLIASFERLSSALASLAKDGTPLREVVPSTNPTLLTPVPSVVLTRTPTVFISSTSEDLKDYREQAAKAALTLGFLPDMMEDFPTSARESVPEYLDRVARADVVVAIVAHRYGWIPDDTNPKSITWLECEHAWKTGKEVLALLVDPTHPWPAELREDYRLVKERKTPGIAKEVERNEQKLDEFKKELSRYFRKQFTDAASIRALVSEGLSDWRLRNAPAAKLPPGDPEVYLKFLEDDTRQIRITGLTTKRAEPYFFAIDEIYIPLTTVAHREKEIQQQPRVALEQAVTERKVVIVGDPGSGKSTFLRRVAFELCRNLRGGASSFLAPNDRRFPILIRVADFAKLLAADRAPKPDHSPDWIPHFLGKLSNEFHWGLNEDFFKRKLDTERCLLLMDGLDEAPEQHIRERIARIFERATQAFKKCDFLVSTRPQTNFGDSVLKDFHPLRIADLERPEIEIFFDHFVKALALTDAESRHFKQELTIALDGRIEIREMATNAVMLTALAVLQHNDQRLPEYRVDLYGSILNWLAQARQHEGRPKPKECIDLVRRLALHMQDAPEGRLVQINKRAAAEFLAAEFGGAAEKQQESLESETHHSGIISSVGNDLKFWHLSFQEYLAALEIGGLNEKEQIKRLVDSGKLYQPEWRETMRLLGGVLFEQGPAKVEGLFKAILGRLADRPQLADQARCAALLGAMMRDLSRMGYQPKTPAYEQTVKAMERIFEPAAESIDLQTRIEAADALGQIGDPRLDRDNWIVIPAGKFLMGAQQKNKKGPNYDPKAFDEEGPVHEVTLRAFRIQRYPVTVHEYAAFLAAGAPGLEEFREPDDWESQKQYPNRPVVNVTWFEAAAYCSWFGGRLSTEAEWERAARGPMGWRYPWGNEPSIDPSRANYSNGPGHVTPVGLYSKGNTAEGLCDMLGNVWEWCADWFGPYETERQENPIGPPEGNLKILRGGAWYSIPQVVRPSDRYRFEPAVWNYIIGFRCAGELS
jgi:formylglycine-generating enzyme required for sulfatase activity